MGYGQSQGFDLVVVVNAEPTTGHGKPPKSTPFVRFEGVVGGMVSQLTIWGKTIQFLPPQGLHAGYIVHCKAERKDDFNGVPTYWISSVERVDTSMVAAPQQQYAPQQQPPPQQQYAPQQQQYAQPQQPQQPQQYSPQLPQISAGVPAPAAPTPPVAPSYSPNAMDYRQALKFFDVTIKQLAKITRDVYPEASDDIHLQVGQALCVTLYIAQGQGKLKVKLASDEEVVPVDTRALVDEIAAKLRMSSAAMGGAQ